MSNVAHNKKLERRHCETITKEHFCSMNFYRLRDYLAMDEMKHFKYTYKESYTHHQEPTIQYHATLYSS